MLQYVESSVASHLMVVPKNPKMPDPKMPPPPPPPPLRKLPFAIVGYELVIQYREKQNVIPKINTNKKKLN